MTDGEATSTAQKMPIRPPWDWNYFSQALDAPISPICTRCTNRVVGITPRSKTWRNCRLLKQLSNLLGMLTPRHCQSGTHRNGTGALQSTAEHAKMTE